MLELCLGAVRDGAEGSPPGSWGLGHIQTGSVRQTELVQSMAGVLVPKSQLNLGLAAVSQQEGFLGINRKGSDCSGGILLLGKLKVVSVNKVALESHRKWNFIYSKQCVCSKSFRYFCCPLFKKEINKMLKLEIIIPCKCVCVERECES